MIGAERIGAENRAVTKAAIDSIGGKTEAVVVLDFVLLEAKLGLGLVLDFIERNADDTERRWEILKELTCDADNICVGMNRVAQEDIFVDRQVIVGDGPNINAMRVEFSAAEADAGVFGEMDDAGFDFLMAEAA